MIADYIVVTVSMIDSTTTTTTTKVDFSFDPTPTTCIVRMLPYSTCAHLRTALDNSSRRSDGASPRLMAHGRRE